MFKSTPDRIVGISEMVVVRGSFVYIFHKRKVLLGKVWVRPHLPVLPKNSLKGRRETAPYINGEMMSASGTGKNFLSCIGVILSLSLIGFLIYEYSGIFKPASQKAGDEVIGGAHKIDKNALIATLEKQIRSIPAEDAAANLAGYERLLKLSPQNIRYNQKIAYYRARIKESDGNSRKIIGAQEYIKVGYPSPRVLDAPETGEMLGRVDSGSLVEILDTKAIESTSLKLVWYKIPFQDREGWLSKLGTSGDVIVTTVDPGNIAGKLKKAPGPGPWEKLAATMINDYQGKIISIDRLDIIESHFSLYSGMNAEQVRQTCENIGYYIRNSTGESPVIVVFIDRIPVAKAHPAGTKYQAALVTE